MFKISKKTEYMYKYMIGFLFLNFAIYSDIHYSISDKFVKYFKYIKFICLVIIIYMCSIDISSGILLAIAFVLFDNIINIKHYLRELFTNYYEKFSNSFVLTNKEAKEIKDHCVSEEWDGQECSQLKKHIRDICHQETPLKKMEFGEGKKKVTLDCPKIIKTF